MQLQKLFIFFLFICLSCNQQKEDEQIKARITDLTESVYASVTVQPRQKYFPQSIRSGIIQQIFVEEGDTVKMGQLLYKISTTGDIQSRLKNAQLNVQEATANYKGQDNLLRNIETELENVRQQLQLDSLNLVRQKRLWAQRIGKKIDLDRAELEYQSTQNNQTILQKKYAQTLTNLETNFQRAQSQLAAERSNQQDFAVRSKIAGRVYSINKEAGELVSTQERFMEIGSVADFVLEMDIDEVDITKVELGDTVIITLDAYPDATFSAKVSGIAPQKDVATQTFQVESVFLQAPPKLFSGLAGEANIIIDVRENVLIIPTEYLLPNNKVITPAGEKEVKIGVKNIQFIEIVAGIDSSTVLIKPEQL
ncbi:MAG: efflux RND transporter periplasmic adaptor subunit [Saprospiraceae bacterium]